MQFLSSSSSSERASPATNDHATHNNAVRMRPLMRPKLGPFRETGRTNIDAIPARLATHGVRTLDPHRMRQVAATVVALDLQAWLINHH